MRRTPAQQQRHWNATWLESLALDALREARVLKGHSDPASIARLRSTARTLARMAGATADAAEAAARSAEATPEQPSLFAGEHATGCADLHAPNGHRNEP
jgi:hypothetical protein